MVDLHNILDSFFARLDNTGSVSNDDLVKIVILSLIDDYGHDMIRCNVRYKRILEDLVSQIGGSSCMFRIGSWDDDRYDIDSEHQTIIVPSQYVPSSDNECDLDSITNNDIDNLVK